MGNCFSCLGQKNKNYKCLKDEIPICKVISRGEQVDVEACLHIKDQTSQQNLQSQVSSTSQNNSSGANLCAQNFPLVDSLQIKAKTALIYPPLLQVPGSSLKKTTQDWHGSVSQALRHHSVQKIVQASFPTTDLATLRDNIMIFLIDSAQKSEEGMFSAANNQEEYCQLVDEKVRKLEKEFDDRKQKRRELVQQRRQVSGPITSMIGNNAAASTNPTTFPGSMHNHHFNDYLDLEDSMRFIPGYPMIPRMPPLPPPPPMFSSEPTSRYNPNDPFQIPPLPVFNPYHSHTSTVPPFPSTSHSLLPPLYSPNSTLPVLRPSSLNSEYSQSNTRNVPIQHSDYQPFSDPSLPRSSFLPKLTTHSATHSNSTDEVELPNYNLLRSSNSLNAVKESRDNAFSFDSGYGASSSKPVKKESARWETEVETNLNSELNALQQMLNRLEEKESIARSLPANHQKSMMGLFLENSKSTTSDNLTQEMGSPLQNPTASVLVSDFLLKDQSAGPLPGSEKTYWQNNQGNQLYPSFRNGASWHNQ